MIGKLGGQRFILTLLLVLAFIGSCFYSGISDVKFGALLTLATAAINALITNKATKDKA